jgi:hypothetical protein
MSNFTTPTLVSYTAFAPSLLQGSLPQKDMELELCSSKPDNSSLPLPHAQRALLTAVTNFNEHFADMSYRWRLPSTPCMTHLGSQPGSWR